MYAKPNMCVLAAALEKFRARALGFAMRRRDGGMSPRDLLAAQGDK